ncbi:BRO-N domain-containing protein [Laspinema olomoucense]|uniref:BRO-N domain-containing protein n=1 Tax=Laspinema olomoucense TaxID=3231600 RepID=UPI0021BB88D1|nr:Bro-N domain-containing protein [Laspinema sp. D3c]MCT7992505.1 Bro-N domain-containing protein [Laspinema sp. D3c]
MTNLSIFNFHNNQVRIVIIDGKPWFVAKDLCEVLEIKNSRDALTRLDDDEKDTVGITDAIGRKQDTAIVSESGMYALILSSRKPQAKPFRKWVTSEVLTAIRQEGFYSVSGQPMAPFWYQRLLLDGTKNKAPLGHFTIFREVIDLVRDLEANGYVLPDNAYPDISVGLCWSNHLHCLGINPDTIRQSYRHHYPDGRIVTASAYENLYLPEFRDWFNRMYLSDKLPKYLGKKDKSSLPALEKLLELPPGTINRLLTSSPISQSA